MTTGYLFDNAAEREASQRMTALSTLHDAATFLCLSERGITAGWRCLEVGGGNGSVARWMAERVALSGHVLVTVIDPRFIAKGMEGAPANLELRRHDIVVDPLPGNAFDLTRLVLLWLPARLKVLARPIDALRPGGWLVTEDYDALLVPPTMVTAKLAAAESFARMTTALRTWMTDRQADLVWARQLYRNFRDGGLLEVGMNGAIDVRQGGSAGAAVQKANFSQVRMAAVEAGLITEDEVAEVMRNLDDPTFDYVAPTVMTAWGRRPVSP